MRLASLACWEGAKWTALGSTYAPIGSGGGCRQARRRLCLAPLVPVSLRDPRANGMTAWLEFAGKIIGITSRTDQVDHLWAKFRRIRRTCTWHRQHLWRETQGVHQTGSTSSRSSVWDR